MNKFRTGAATMAAVILLGCSVSISPQNAQIPQDVPRGKVDVNTANFAIVLDNAGNPRCELEQNDPTCNAEGPGQLMAVSADGCCRLYFDEHGCMYPELGGTTLECAITPCADDADCFTQNPDEDNLSAGCIPTQTAFNQSDWTGACLFAWADCEVLPGTPCHDSGVVFCENGECACTAEADMDAATAELCDGLDNDCDGEADNGFALGEACDADDADLCANGAYVCAGDGLSVECSEVGPNFVETCNGQDDDCNGDVDEDFPKLGDSCDGNDPDFCEKGERVCTADGSGVECSEVGQNFVEVCDGLDNDCDGLADDGCDDDEDGWCDSIMLVGIGGLCQIGDCDDADTAINPDADELCNLKDDDCDGQINEGYHLGDACTVGQGACAVESGLVCTDDGLASECDVEADPDQASPETCNGQDDDCDGLMDEGCDDDLDGRCDNGMVSAGGAACVPGDCNDGNQNVHAEANEACEGLDNDCDGLVDEGCDDDNDGWCDSAMLIGEGAAACEAGDCNDMNGDINPGVQEQCVTAFDDNCDGDTEFLLDGVTPACDSCANALELPCGEAVVLDMASALNAANGINSYQCWTRAGVKRLSTVFDAPEIVVVPDALAGTLFSLQIQTPGTGTVAFRLHGSCEPGENTTAVWAYHDAEDEDDDLDGTCASYGASSVAGGVVGEDFVALDAASARQVTVRFTCQPPN